jgi:hypothetical protein
VERRSINRAPIYGLSREVASLHVLDWKAEMFGNEEIFYFYVMAAGTMETDWVPGIQNSQ